MQTRKLFLFLRTFSILSLSLPVKKVPSEFQGDLPEMHHAGLRPPIRQFLPRFLLCCCDIRKNLSWNPIDQYAKL